MVKANLREAEISVSYVYARLAVLFEVRSVEQTSRMHENRRSKGHPLFAPGEGIPSFL